MKSIKFIANKIIHLAYILFFLSACNNNEPQPKSIQEVVDQIVFPHIALGSNVGIIVGVIKGGEKTVYSYGEKELGSKEKITAQGVFEIASATKTFTAIALADMHLKGEVSLDDPIEMYLPSTVNVPSFNGKKITLRHLANHTSGFPRQPSNMNSDAYNPYKDYDEEKMYDFISHFTLSSEPGTNYEYSNVGYGLLGQILSLTNNTDYETVIATRILQPLGMAHTAVTFTDNQLNYLVPGHFGNRKVESWSKYMQNIIQGTGSLNSSMDDMILYLEANMGKVSALQEAMTLTHTLTKAVSHEKYYQDGIALGWSLFTTDGQSIIWKNGLNGGYSSFIGFNKATQTGVVILCNSSLNPDLFQTDMGFEILKGLDHL